MYQTVVFILQPLYEVQGLALFNPVSFSHLFSPVIHRYGSVRLYCWVSYWSDLVYTANLYRSQVLQNMCTETGVQFTYTAVRQAMHSACTTSLDKNSMACSDQKMSEKEVPLFFWLFLDTSKN